MTAQELLIYLTEKKIGDLFSAARRLPPDKLEWKPAPGARCALDMLQEVATAHRQFKSAHLERKIEWDQDKMANWFRERSKYTDLDELERMTRENTAEISAFLREMPVENFQLPVQMPFPGDFNLADILAYTYWNMSYHEGQINYIGSLLSAP